MKFGKKLSDWVNENWKKTNFVKINYISKSAFVLQSAENQVKIFIRFKKTYVTIFRLDDRKAKIKYISVKIKQG